MFSQPQYRLGDPKKLPNVDPKHSVYDPTLSKSMKVYAFLIGVHANLLYEYCHVSPPAKMNVLANLDYICISDYCS